MKSGLVFLLLSITTINSYADCLFAVKASCLSKTNGNLVNEFFFAAKLGEDCADGIDGVESRAAKYINKQFNTDQICQEGYVGAMTVHPYDLSDSAEDTRTRVNKAQKECIENTYTNLCLGITDTPIIDLTNFLEE